MPLTDGWHPYFTLGKKINTLEVWINSKKIVGFDKRLLPDGSFTDAGVYNTAEILGGKKLDYCFLLDAANKPACVIKDAKAGLQLSVMPGRAYPYLQVYTPKHRKSIAIENLSSVPDAFNNKIGLIILSPGKQKLFTTSYKIDLTN